MERKRGGELTELSWQKELRAQTGKRCMGRMMLGLRKRMRIFIHVTVVTLLVDCMHLLNESSSNYPTHKKETLSGNLCVHNWSPASKFQLSKQPASKTENIRPWKNCPWPCAGSFSPLALLVRLWQPVSRLHHILSGFMDGNLCSINHDGDTLQIWSTIHSVQTQMGQIADING